MAPGLPMAAQATGTPPGIWTVESRASSPASVVVAMGTPTTGSGNSARSVPSAWAEMAVYNPFDFFLEPGAEHFPLKYDDQLRRDLAPFLDARVSGARK